MPWALTLLLIVVLPIAACILFGVALQLKTKWFPRRCPCCGVGALQQTDWIRATIVIYGRRAPDSWSDYRCAHCAAMFRQRLGRRMEPRERTMPGEDEDSTGP